MILKALRSMDWRRVRQVRRVDQEFLYPTDTYRSGDYCKPLPSSTTTEQAIIEKSGSKGPTGYYSSGNYCKQYSSESDKEAIPRDKGSDCPGGWHKSGRYCVKYGE